MADSYVAPSPAALAKRIEELERQVKALKGSGGDRRRPLDPVETLLPNSVGVPSLATPLDPESLFAANSVDGDIIDTAAAVTITGQNLEGTADTIAKSDHDHDLPDYGTNFGDDLTVVGQTLSPSASNRLYLIVTPILHRVTLTGIRFRGADANGSLRSALYDSTGARVANDTGGTANANTVVNVPFDATYDAAPGIYVRALLASSTFATIYSASARLHNASIQTEGSFVTPSSITFPTTFSTVASIACCTY